MRKADVASAVPSGKARALPGLDVTRPALSIAIPAYNESENVVSGRLEALDRYLGEALPNTEIIVIDDGSEDETAEIIERFSIDHPRFSVIRNPHHGKAWAVMTGILAARGNCVLFMDMDMSTSIEHISEFAGVIERGEADVVTASREVHGAVRHNAPWLRRFLGKGFNVLVQALLLPGISDTQCGFKAFSGEAARTVFSRLVVFGEAQEVVGPNVTAFDVELLVAARRHGYRIRQRGVDWTHAKTRRVNLVKEPWRMLRQLLLVWLNDRRGRYSPARAAELAANESPDI